jgi:4-hydroxy-tetrahydrodipicolinate synthase
LDVGHPTLAERGRLRGVVVPVCTPLTPDLAVDVASLERLVDFLIAGGVDALFVLGSTSEVAYLPDGHRQQVLDVVTGRISGQLPVLAGVIDMTTLRVADQATAPVKAGCDGVVATAPFYTRTHPEEIERHFRLLAELIPIPLYAYDLPVSVHNKLDPDLLLTLGAEGLLAGVKDSSGDDAGLRTLLMHREELGAALDHFAVLTGSELLVDSALAMGADGVVPGLGNVHPAGYASIYRSCVDGDWATAREEQERLIRLFDIVRIGDRQRMGASSAGLGAFKTALHLLGVIACPVTAPPQTPLSTSEVDAIGAILTSAGLL